MILFSGVRMTNLVHPPPPNDPVLVPPVPASETVATETRST